MSGESIERYSRERAMEPVAVTIPSTSTGTSNPHSPSIPNRQSSLSVHLASPSTSPSTSRVLPSSPSKMTTFILPAEHPSASATTSSANEGRERGNSILGRLGRKLSQSKKTHSIIRRVSGSTPTPTKSTTPSVRSQSSNADKRDDFVFVDEPDSPSRPNPTLRRSLKVLGRSKSEGKQRAEGRREVVMGVSETDGIIWLARDSARKRGQLEGEVVKEREKEGNSKLFWEERLGICWDGREQVHPDLSIPSFQAYSSNSDVLPPQSHSPSASPSRIIYASTLSTFPPRPPLKSRLSCPSPSQNDPSLTLTPANQVIVDYLTSLRERGEYLNTPEGDNEDETTPIPTPKAMVGDYASEEEGASSEDEDGWRKRDSEDSSTSLESMGRQAAYVGAGLGRKFLLKDDGPVPREEVMIPPPSQRDMKKELPLPPLPVSEDEDSDGDSIKSGDTKWMDCE